MKHLPTDDLTSDAPFTRLLAGIQEQIIKMTSPDSKEKQTSVIIEDLSAFEQLGIPLKQICVFVNEVSRAVSQNGGSTILFTKIPPQSLLLNERGFNGQTMDSNTDAMRLYTFLSHRSNLVLHVAPLTSGMSDDISGAITVIPGGSQCGLVQSNSKSRNITTLQSALYSYGLAGISTAGRTVLYKTGDGDVLTFSR